MAGFKVDFTNVEVKNFDPVPRGKYLLCATGFEVMEVKEGKNAGKPRVQFEFGIQEPTHVMMEGQETKIENRKLWENFYPTIDSTLFRLKAFLGALGQNVEGDFNFDPDEIMTWDADARLFVGKVKITPARKDKATGQEYAARNEIADFYRASTWKAPTQMVGSGGGGGSLLP